MNHCNLRRARNGARRVIRCGGIGFLLVTAAALAQAQSAAPPAAAPAAQPGPPYRILEENVRVDVHADFSFTEHTERRIKLLSLRGVQISRMLPLGVPSVMGGPDDNLMHPAGGIKIESAYTLQPGGQHIPAVPTEPPPPPPGISQMHGPMDGATWMSFPQARVGDVLVISYVGSYKGVPGAPGIFLLDEAFPKYMPMDDVRVTVTAPADMKLAFRTREFSPASHTRAGSIQRWMWHYRNSLPPVVAPGSRASMEFAAVHISSFASAQAESAFFTRRMQASLSMPGAPNGCMNVPDLPTDGPRGMEMLLVNLDMYYKDGADNFGSMIDGLNSPDCVFDDGRPKITLLSSVFDSSIDPKPGGWQKSYAYIRMLQKKFPGKAFPALAEAEYWIDYAFDARGGGYADTVTAEGWKLFHQRLQKAEQVLTQSKPYAASFPTWYEQMVMVEFLLDRPAHDQAVVFQEGLSRYPAYYPLYFRMVDFASPKWGGSWQAVDNFVKWSVAATRDKEAETLYARLYWYAYQRLMPGEELFRDTLASWPTMQRGFDDLLARHPKSHWDLNNYAHFACMAGDKATYRKLRRRIGKDVVPEAWRGAPTLDVCRAQFGI